MKTIYKFIFSSCIFLISVVCFTSCNNDLIVNEEKAAVLNISVPNVLTRGGNLFLDESMIAKVRIYVFDGNYVQSLHIFNSGETAFENPFRVNTTTGSKTVYVVANEHVSLSSTLDAVTTISALKAVITSTTGSSAMAPFMMSGHSTININYVSAPGNPTQVSVNLKRIVAKVTLAIKKSQETTADIKIKGVRLFRATSKGSLFEDESVGGQFFWGNNYSLSTPVTLTTSDYNFVWGGTGTSIYLYENQGSVADTLGRASYILIDAIYNGIDSKYKAYINDNSSNADHHFSIKRNHHYQLSATISNIGEYDEFILNTNILPWDVVTSEREFSGFMYSGPAAWNPSVATQATSAKFTFTMNNPKGGLWKATITNGLDFAFKPGTPITGTSGISYTIEVIALKAPASVARQTEFYLTVDGEEVDTNGNGIIGNGGRYIIRQNPQ